MGFITKTLRPIVLQLLLAIGFCSGSFGQNFDYHRDFDAYLSRSTDPGSPFFYGSLLTRFEAGDSTLESKDILHLLIGSRLNRL